MPRLAFVPLFLTLGCVEDPYEARFSGACVLEDLDTPVWAVLEFESTARSRSQWSYLGSSTTALNDEVEEDTFTAQANVRHGGPLRFEASGLTYRLELTESGDLLGRCYSGEEPGLFDAIGGILSLGLFLGSGGSIAIDFTDIDAYYSDGVGEFDRVE